MQKAMRIVLRYLLSVWAGVLTSDAAVKTDGVTLPIQPGIFSGVRVGAQIGLSRHSLHPAATKNIVMYSPLFLGYINAGKMTSKVVYYGFRAFGGYLYGREVADKWVVLPRYEGGLTAVIGSVVEETFLTSIEVGVKKIRYDITDPTQKGTFKESMNMAVIGLKTEGILTNTVSSEVSYMYGLAISSNDADSKITYTKRASTHTFSLGLVIKL